MLTQNAEVVTLTFDPETVKDPELRAVFKDEIARNLWLAIRRDHMVDQYFNANCLRVAAWLRKECAKRLIIMPCELKGQLSNPLLHWCMVGWGEKGIAEKLMPYARMEKVIQYQIKEQ